MESRGILALAAGAFFVWFTVRLLNRGKRPRKWFWAVVSMVLAYPALLGPCCWISSRTGWGHQLVTSIYRPLVQLTEPTVVDNGLLHHTTGALHPACNWYSELGAAEGWHWAAVLVNMIVTYPEGQFFNDNPDTWSIEWHWQS
jgi:hypothetical protein